MREPKYPWRDRFELLAQNLLNSVQVAFFFDNFEDNLTGGAPPDELAAMLARWLQSPGSSRLVFTSRYPFELPDEAQDRLQAFHLGPLSWAETRKLLWRLEGLERFPRRSSGKPMNRSVATLAPSNISTRSCAAVRRAFPMCRPGCAGNWRKKASKIRPAGVPTRRAASMRH